MESRPVVIVGSGPGGAGTALYLHQRSPGLAAETLILEKARHPRFKVCAGGLLPHAVSCLQALGLELQVPHVVVHRALVRTPSRTVVHHDRNLCYVIRRAEFDAYLVNACRERGIEVREGERVLDLERDATGIRVVTDRAEYHARLLVGADGSSSLVRRRLVGPLQGRLGRAVMCDVPAARLQEDRFEAQRYEFDFRLVRRGLAGYRWVFPCSIDGVLHANVGVYAWRAGTVRLQDALTEYLREMTCLRPHRFAFGIHWYAPGQRLAAPHVLLVGDAAGADPLMGEGISLALQYGALAAQAAEEAFRRGDFSGFLYQHVVQESWFGKKLRRLHLAARLFYGSMGRLCFFLAEQSPKARAVGLRWYNGVDGWDRRSGWEALRAVLFSGRVP